MGIETEPSEFDHLQRRGKSLGLHVERHRVFDPSAPGGDLYVQQRRAIYNFEGGTGNPPSLLRYATAEQVRTFLSERVSK
jgi:hypothetical protein